MEDLSNAQSSLYQVSPTYEEGTDQTNCGLCKGLFTAQCKPHRVSFHPILLMWIPIASPSHEQAICALPMDLCHIIFSTACHHHVKWP
jgi:hypothetical protein